MIQSIQKIAGIVLCLYALCACVRDKKPDYQEEISFSNYKSFPDTNAFDPSWSKNNTLVYHTTSDPENLHPTNGTSSVRSEINLYLHMALLRIDLKSQEVVPELLKTLPAISADGLEYTYDLRDDARWDDGTPLTTDDALFFIKSLRCPLTNNAFTKLYYENIKEIRADAKVPGRFIMVMKHAYIQNNFFLSDFPVIERKFYDPQNVLARYSLADFDDPDFKPEQHNDLVAWAAAFNDEKNGREPARINGMGPYKLEQWDQGQSITLVKKKNHWTDHSKHPNEMAYPEKIIFHINKDDNSTMLEFKTQTLDASGLLSAKSLIALKSNPEFNKNYHSAFVPSYHYTYIGMNEKPDGEKHKKIFDDVRVRKAMAYLTPVDEIIRLVYGEYGNSTRRMTTIVSPLKNVYDASLPAIPLDIHKASALLDEAGWKDSNNDGIRDKMIGGKSVDLSFDFYFLSTSSDWKDMAAITAEQMLKAGVKATPVGLELKVLIEKARSHDFDILMGSWSSSCLPEDYTQLWHTSSWANNGSNYTGFGTPATDSLIDSIKTTLDPEKNKAMVMRLQKIVYDDQPFIFIYNSLRRCIMHKRFGNCEFYSERPGMLLQHSILLGGTGPEMKNGVSPH